MLVLIRDVAIHHHPYPSIINRETIDNLLL